MTHFIEDRPIDEQWEAEAAAEDAGELDDNEDDEEELQPKSKKNKVRHITSVFSFPLIFRRVPRNVVLSIQRRLKRRVMNRHKRQPSLHYSEIRNRERL